MHYASVGGGISETFHSIADGKATKRQKKLEEVKAHEAALEREQRLLYSSHKNLGEFP